MCAARWLTLAFVGSAMAQSWLSPHRESRVGSENALNWMQPTAPNNCATYGPPLELIHEVHGHFPTGVAVDTSNRLFFAIPRSATKTARTVSIQTSFRTEEPWPNKAIQNCEPGQNVSTCFVNVQNVVIDSTQKRIWVLDTGIPTGEDVALKYGAKVWSFNLFTKKPLRNYVLPHSLTNGGMNINDIRFNLSLSKSGVGFITDEQGSLVTLDLHTGIYKRHLYDQKVTRYDDKFVGSYNGEPFYQWQGLNRSYLQIGADGIALAGGNLYFAPLASRRLYQIPQKALIDESMSSDDLIQQVQFIGQVGSYTQGFTADDQGRVYMGTGEQNSISYFNTSLSSITKATTLNGLPTKQQNGTIPASDILIEPYVRSAFIQWADSMCIQNEYLVFTTNQLPLMPQYQRGNVDRREKPFKIYRTYVGAGPAV